MSWQDRFMKLYESHMSEIIILSYKSSNTIFVISCTPDLDVDVIVNEYMNKRSPEFRNQIGNINVGV